MRSNTYRRWRTCFDIARACGYGRFVGAVLALVFMHQLDIQVKREKI